MIAENDVPFDTADATVNVNVQFPVDQIRQTHKPIRARNVVRASNAIRSLGADNKYEARYGVYQSK